MRASTRAARQKATARILPHSTGQVAAQSCGDLADAESQWRKTLQRNPRHPLACRALSDLAHQSERYEEAAQLLGRIAETPADFSNLGVALEKLGRSDEAEAAYRRSLAIDPTYCSAHVNLGNLCYQQQRAAEAEGSFRAALALQPHYAKAWNGLGSALQAQGQLTSALEAFRTSVQHDPGSANAHCNLGTLLFALDQNVEALAELKQALRLEPNYALAHGNLGALLVRGGYPVAAESASRTAMALSPRQHSWVTNLAVALLLQGRHTEAEAYYRQALAMRPDYPGGHGNLLFALNYRCDLTAETIFAEYQEWDRRHGRQLTKTAPPFTLDRTAGRKLRVGYVSADFRQHAVAMFAEPLLAAHDRSNIEIYLFAGVAAEDAATQRFRLLADHWRSTIALSDAALAELIRADQIDILVDLSGHTAGNRLPTFARRAAPVQIAYLLGHGYSTGLSAIDAFLADDFLAPEGTEALFSERVIRLPRIPLVYAPPADMPAVAGLPALANGFITFGHFGRTERLNDNVISTWARILQAIPRSRLVLDNRPFQEPAFCALFLARFAAHGVDPTRVQLTYSAPQPNAWAAYSEIDIGLDPFPHNAGTTTIEALWQGVPSVSLAGRPTVGRFGASILHAVGLDDWVVGDVDAYISRAVAATADLASLAALRASLRQRVAASPLCDAGGLSRAIEATYRSLWDAWRAGNPQHLHQLYQAGRLADATALAQDMVARNEAPSEAHHVLGLLAYRDNRLTDAHRHLTDAIAHSPPQAELYANHAAILRKLGRLTDAERAARKAIELDPRRDGAYNNLGNILRDLGRIDESAECYRKAIQLVPTSAEAWVNLAWLLALSGHAQQAEETARKAISCDARNADAHNNLGLALMRQGRLAEAEAALRQALALRPDFALPHSNILFCLNYRTDIAADDIFAEYREWDRRHARPLLPAAPRHDLNRSPQRRLRVGYVSPDFRQHAVALFAEPLLAAHDHAAVEIHCYSELATPDAVTERFHALADCWHDTVGLSDGELAEQIRHDGIDVLVDLAGHTAGNRLLVFARKPAPVQVAWLVGHGYTSGLSAMDAFLADVVLAPPGAEPLFSEKLIRLTRIPLAYAPPAGMPDVSPLPAHAKGYVTFGYFGRTVRLNDAVLAAWARILQALPNSRLILNNAPFGEPAGRERMAARFAALGIQAARLELIFTTPQPQTWDAYRQVDIALDPFPHNAGTTTIEALWQGVPVVSLAGNPTVGRFGAAILHAVGLDDWVTTDTDAYVNRAVAAAADLDALAALRTQLRPRFAASPLCDATGLAREVEAAYRSLWHHWCNVSPQDLRELVASGDLEGAALLAERRLAIDPQDAVALHVLGLSHFSKCDASMAAVLLQRSVDAQPDAAVWSDLGVVLRSLGRQAQAEAAYRHALEMDPSLVPALGNLGNVLLDLRRPGEAEALLTRALTLQGDQPWLLRSLALSQMARGAVKLAEAALRQALAIDPADPDVHDTLGALLGQSGRPIEAEAHHRAALLHTKQRHRVLSNLATVLQSQGRHAEAVQHCREALALQPGYQAAQGNLLFATNYRNDMSGEAIFAEYRNWDRRIANLFPLTRAAITRPTLADRRLRIGYVSADFRYHAAAWFAEPLLAAHDRSCVELFCYGSTASPDAVTDRFRAIAEHWRDIAGVPDETVAAMVEQDGIDVLVDMTGHTAGSRLLMFARKPAPVQVAYLLGHGYSSGLSAMDAFLADEILVPPGADALFSERVVRLPRIPLAYAPPNSAPPVTALPALASGCVTFGYFGRTERLNNEVLDAWAGILRAVPGSQLVLNSRPYGEAAFCDLIAGRFAKFGIQRAQLRLIATTSHAATSAAYGAIDVALDPFPHNAGTTTFEALWQGVPVVSLACRPSVGRFGAMILHAVNMDDWCGRRVEDYQAQAIAAAADLPVLARLRAELRQRIARSPLCDAAGLARHIEAAYVALYNAASDGNGKFTDAV